MRGAVLFVTGLIVGLAVHIVMAQSPPAREALRAVPATPVAPAGSGSGVEMANHIGVNVPNVTEAVTYYSTKMGFKEAFRVNDPSGQPRIVYMQISRNTFLELQPATPQRGAGFTHYGLVVANAAASVDAFRKLGLTVTDVTKSDTKVNLANLTDPYIGRIELVEITPESLHAKAIAGWQ